MTGSFEDLVGSRGAALWRLAWLLTGQDERAEELVEVALARVWPRWSELTRDGESPETAARRELVAAFLRTSRPPDRPWSGWVRRARASFDRRDAEPVAATPSAAVDVLGPAAGSGVGADSGPEPDDRRTALLRGLGRLEPEQRAALALARSGDLSRWDAADALGVGSDRFDSMEQGAESRLRAVDVRAAELLPALPEVVPPPPYDATRAARVRDRARGDRRRRRRRTLVAAGVAAALIGVPVLLSQTADPDDAAGDDAGLAVADSLVDPLPIPDRCVELPDEPPAPDIAYDADGAEAVWMRFCPAPDVSGDLDAIDFAPDVTIVTLDLDQLVDRWTEAPTGPLSCDYQAFAGQGTIRAQLGTLDGALHVVDLRVGTCGTISVDGVELSVEGRTAFAEAVGVLGTELLGQVDAAGGTVAEPTFCPSRIEEVAGYSRTTVRDLPQVRGLPLPLPAAGALICQYPPSAEAGPQDPETRFLNREDAERLRAAFLARPALVSPCPQSGAGTRYAVVVTDVTSSRRTFTVDLGGCAAVRGPASATGAAGPWLTELLGEGLDRAGFGRRLSQ